MGFGPIQKEFLHSPLRSLSKVNTVKIKTSFYAPNMNRIWGKSVYIYIYIHLNIEKLHAFLCACVLASTLAVHSKWLHICNEYHIYYPLLAMLYMQAYYTCLGKILQPRRATFSGGKKGTYIHCQSVNLCFCVVSMNTQAQPLGTFCHSWCNN